MAVKKKSASKAEGASASRTKAAPRKAASRTKASAGSAVAETTAKVGTPKATATKKGAKKAAPKKASAPIKLSDSQKKLLDAIHATRDQGYLAEKKGEAKTLDSLSNKKLIKRGAKDKASGHYRYTVSKAGEKHIGSSSPTT